MMVKSMTLQHNGESDSASLYSEVLCFWYVSQCDGTRILSLSKLIGDSVNSAALDSEVPYRKFSV